MLGKATPLEKYPLPAFREEMQELVARYEMGEISRVGLEEALVEAFSRHHADAMSWAK